MIIEKYLKEEIPKEIEPLPPQKGVDLRFRQEVKNSEDYFPICALSEMQYDWILKARILRKYEVREYVKKN